MGKIRHISIELLDRCKGKKQNLNALVFALQLKDRYVFSHISHFTYEKLRKDMNCGKQRATKNIKILEEMGIVRFIQRDGWRDLKINPIKAHKIKLRNGNYMTPKHLDITIPGNMDLSNKRIVKLFLGASYIKLHSDRQAYIKNCTKNEKSKRNNHPKRECANNLRKYADDGLARNTIQRDLCCSDSTCSKIINYGVNKQMFLKVRRVYKINPADPHKIPFGSDFRLRKENTQPMFVNRQGQVCIVFPNVYLSTKKEYILDSLMTRYELLAGIN